MAQAILNGTIVDDGGLPCEGRFQYGQTLALGTFTPWQGGALRTGDSFQQLITGLFGNTIYYFRAEARNAAGAGTPGSILSFITTSAIGGPMPSVAAMAAVNITEHSARIRGMVLDDGGRAGRVRFQYGLTSSYGVLTPWQDGFITSDEFYADIINLSPETVYHFQAQFQNNPLVSSGDAVFSTLALLGGLAFVDENILSILEAA